MRCPLRSRSLLALSVLSVAGYLAPACSNYPSVDGDEDEGDGDGDGSGGRMGLGGGGIVVGTGGKGGDNSAGAMNLGGRPPSEAVCGDSVIESPESCDDSGEEGGDGCSSECQVEEGYACPVPGEECVKLAVCGDGNLGTGEECDDNNARSDDGCTDLCFVEIGWECPTAGSRCVAARCGDGEIVGNEQCEDGDDPPTDGDGCSESCRIEPGHFCPEVGEECLLSECGNGVREGDEPCDDGDSEIGDGCTPLCEREPTCVEGACSSTCGDGMILAGDGEECDDGNLNDDDGCDSSCEEEKGYSCTLVTEDPPDELIIPVVYRDFIRDGRGLDGGVEHPDFETFSGSGVSPNLVLDQLLNGKPQYGGICDDVDWSDDDLCPYNQQLTNKDNFDAWYNDGPLSMRIDSTLLLTRNAGGQYEFDSGGPDFFPIAATEGWVGAGKEQASNGNNFAFTSELKYWFELDGGEELTFSGDDDVWVFINNRLLMDLGGLHSPLDDTVVLTDPVIASLEMTVGHIYEMVLFHAERHTGESNFQLTLNGFVKTKSVCVSDCGDGIVAGDEVCDDGDLGGEYGHCLADCSGLAERCGDASVQEEEGEVCDDGTNLMSYDFNDESGCGPGCQPPARCGDEVVDVAFGEQCDDGNEVDGDGCESNCTYRASCGDGELDKEDGETCDDGDRDNGDGCSQFCTIEIPIIR